MITYREDGRKKRNEREELALHSMHCAKKFNVESIKEEAKATSTII